MIIQLHIIMIYSINHNNNTTKLILIPFYFKNHLNHDQGLIINSNVYEYEQGRDCCGFRGWGRPAGDGGQWSEQVVTVVAVAPCNSSREWCSNSRRTVQQQQGIVQQLLGGGGCGGAGGQFGSKGASVTRCGRATIEYQQQLSWGDEEEKRKKKIVFGLCV